MLPHRLRMATEGHGGIIKTHASHACIKVGEGKDLFFHSSSLQGVEFDDLHEGQKVSFTEGKGPKGPCAENVKPI